MSGRTTTSSLDSISLKLPAGPVTFSFPSSPLAKQYTKANHSFISIPPKSPWCPGAHWHEAYTEHIKVVKGRAKVTIDGKSRLVGPEDGMMTFEKLQIHDFERADKVGKRGEDWEAEDVVIEEWTDPGELTALLAPAADVRQRMASRKCSSITSCRSFLTRAMERSACSPPSYSS